MIAAAAGILGFTAPAFADYNVPKYDKATETIEVYSKATVMGPQAVAKADLEEGVRYTKQTFHLYDSDKDGNTDLVKIEIDQPALRMKDVEGYVEAMEQAYGRQVIEQAYGKDFANMEIQGAEKQTYLAIDEEFNGKYDGFVERILADMQNEKGEPFADGIWDIEEYVSPKIEKFLPPK